MKKILGFISVLFWTAGICAAKPLAENQHWIEQVDGGFVFPVSSSASLGYGLGVGGDILMGYRFDMDFSLSADIGYYDCDQKVTGATSGEWLYTPLMGVARLNFGEGWTRPYVLLGLGIALNTYSITPVSTGIKTSNQETDLLLAPGLGILFIVGNDTALYLQSRMDINFTSTGAAGKPFTDSPTIFIPVKGGISFFVF